MLNSAASRFAEAATILPNCGYRRPSVDARIAAAVLATVAASAAAQVQFATLDKRALPMSRDATRQVAFGDVDGDSDLVFGNKGSVFASEQGPNRLHLNLLRLNRLTVRT